MALNTQLTSSDIANLWTQYINDTMSICMNQHVLKIIEDSDTRTIFEQAIQYREPTSSP
jgi:hypothetical protein